MCGTEEGYGKETAPKWKDSTGSSVGHTVKNYMTVICNRWGAT